MQYIQNRNRLCWVCLFTLCLAFVNGCRTDQPQVENQTGQSQADNGVAGNEILRKSIARYRDAQTYSDQAILKLHYRLSGKWVEEYHPQSVMFQRDDRGNDRFSCKIFNARIRANEKCMTCFVFDLPTGNLDDQVWYNAVKKSNVECWSQLLADPIARHFISGESEIPICQQSDSPLPVIFPITLGMLHSELSAAWLSKPDQVSVVTQNDPDVYQLAIKHGQRTHYVWIDKNTYLIQRLQLDNQVLAEALQKSSEVTDLKLVVDFKNAKIDEPIAQEQFATQLAKRARPVKQFVKIPESFPSKLIGYRLPEFALQSDSTAQIDSSMLRRQTTALMFVDAMVFQSDDVARFLKVAAAAWTPTTRLTVVLCGEKQIAVSTSKKLEKKSKRVNFLFDPNYTSCKKLKLRQLPAVVVCDKKLQVHYFKQISNDPWQDAMVTAIKRIDQGDDVASEMRRDYENFLEEYHRQLTLKNPLRKSETSASLVSQTTPSKNFKQVELWSTALNSPGKICIDDRGQLDIFVLEGFRTVAKLSSRGKIIQRKQLEIPANVGVDQIQMYRNNNGNRWFAVYSKGGQQVFVFDDQWKKLFTFPATGQAKQNLQIRDVILADLDRDNRGEMYINIGGTRQHRGVFRIELDSGNQHASYTLQAVDTIGQTTILARNGQTNIFCATSGGQAVVLNAELIPQKTFSLDGFGVRSTQIDAGKINSCLLTMKNDGGSLIGFAANPKPAWKFDFPSSQKIDSIISIIPTKMNGSAMWMTASSNGVVMLIHENRLVDRFQINRTQNSEVRDMKLSEQAVDEAEVRKEVPAIVSGKALAAVSSEQPYRRLAPRRSQEQPDGLVIFLTTPRGLSAIRLERLSSDQNGQ